MKQLIYSAILLAMLGIAAFSATMTKESPEVAWTAFFTSAAIAGWMISLLLYKA